MIASVYSDAGAAALSTAHTIERQPRRSGWRRWK